jgi:hypothetical protein
LLVKVSERESENERDEILEEKKNRSPETFLGSPIIKIGLAKILERCQPALNEVSFVAH